MPRHHRHRGEPGAYLVRAFAGTLDRLTASNYTRGAIEASTPDGPVSFVISSPGIKRDGLNLRSDGWRLDDFRAAGSPVLWNHEHGRPPIGRAERVYRAGDKLKADIAFDPNDDFAQLVESKVRNGFLKSTSVGWDFTDQNGKTLDHFRMNADYLARSAMYNLNEISVVSVGADPLAVAERSLQLEQFGRSIVDLYDAQERYDSDVTAEELLPALLAECTRMGVDLSPYLRAHPGCAMGTHSMPMADEGMAWDADAHVGKADGAEQLRRMHTWMDPEGDPDAKASYKLPHHTADGDVVWSGVTAAMQRLSSTDIPDGDKAGVHRHLAAHYRQFDKQPPTLRAASSGYTRSTVPETRAVPATTSAPAQVDPQAAALLLAAFPSLKGES